jgi:hypothetical protein
MIPGRRHWRIFRCWLRGHHDWQLISAWSVGTRRGASYECRRCPVVLDRVIEGDSAD